MRPAAGHRLHTHPHLAVRRELEGVRKQVLEDLLQPLGVARERERQRVVDVDMEREILRFGYGWKVRSTHVAQRSEGDFLGFDRHRARFDLRQVEDVVDQREEVGAG